MGRFSINVSQNLNDLTACAKRMKIFVKYQITFTSSFNLNVHTRKDGKVL